MIPYYPVILLSDFVAQLVREDPSARERLDRFAKLASHDSDVELTSIPYKTISELQPEDLVFAKVYIPEELPDVDLFAFPKQYWIHRDYENSSFYTFHPGEVLFNTSYLKYDDLSIEIRIVQDNQNAIHYYFKDADDVSIWVHIPLRNFSQNAPIVLQEICRYYDTGDPYVFKVAPKFMIFGAHKIIIHWINKKLRRKLEQKDDRFAIKYDGKTYDHTRIVIEDTPQMYTSGEWVSSTHAYKYIKKLVVPKKYLPPWFFDTPYGEKMKLC